MKHAIVAILILALTLFLPGHAHASKRRTGIIVVSVGTAIAATGIALVATGIWARSAAPGADTLMGFNRLSNLSTDILVPGGLALILAAPFLALGGFSLAAAERDKAREKQGINLWIAPQGPGLAMGGTF